MHDVLDTRDLVPDEAEQLLHSGYPVAALLAEARSAAADADYGRLEEISARLAAAPLDPTWAFAEPDDRDTLESILAGLPEHEVDRAALPDRVHGAWLGRCVANTMGKPVEGLARDEVRRYLTAAGQWPQTGYLPLLSVLPEGVSHLHESAPFSTTGSFDDVPRDDDLDWTILALAMLEEQGGELTTAAVARSWLDRLPFTQTFTAERAAYRNLVRGVPAERAALVENPYREWIGALIRADVHGYVHPGRPGRAARSALADARLSHTGNGVFGAVWAAALVSAALTADTARGALEIAVRAIPSSSRLALALSGVLQLQVSGHTAEEALGWVDQTLGHYNWVHTVNNAALISVGLLWGTDFTSSVALTISGGRDTDSTAATVGSVFGALHGKDSIPEALVGTTHVRVRSAVRDFDRVPIAELARRTLALEEALR
ncbi:MAG: ADP-ribosylation/Crystallin [Naasia sp.]|jgi:ADP-ribosylglycohydrolase|uniref:ADP-ribosylglycohydrolase family protein n=1 Tax=Naasia sp. TaxID=2546198 RepID=UPI00261BA01F|nr:ADP-ribosylglycohydrolase family protein [Naasia sp.]MCU1570156.1 ADP-ribosylation/Crystallin [Naasia sp.]